MKKEIISYVKTILLALILVFIINTWFFKSVLVVGHSMDPTYHDGQRGFSSVISKTIQGLNRFDVVVVKVDDIHLIKRVIGLPYETIEVKDNQLFINNELIEEDFIASQKENYPNFTSDFGPVTIPEEHYFLMGDNRPVSLDSRSQYGPFKESDIISKGLWVFYPFN